MRPLLHRSHRGPLYLPLPLSGRASKDLRRTQKTDYPSTPTSQTRKTVHAQPLPLPIPFLFISQACLTLWFGILPILRVTLFIMVHPPKIRAFRHQSTNLGGFQMRPYLHWTPPALTGPPQTGTQVPCTASNNYLR